jgi:hypothetical protein
VTTSGRLVLVTVSMLGGRLTGVGGSTDIIDKTRIGSVTDKCEVNPNVPAEAYTVTRIAWSTARSSVRATDNASG